MDEIVSYELVRDGFRVVLRKPDGKLLVLTPESSYESDDSWEKYICAVGVGNGVRDDLRGFWVI